MTMAHPAVLAVALTLLVPGIAAPQTPAAASDRWAPWLGCWHVIEESVHDTADLLARLEDPAARATTRARVCVTREGEGVTLTTFVGEREVHAEQMVADGTERPVPDADCRGWQRAEWSPLASRVYASAELSCGEQPVRRVSGLSTVVAGPLWVDIQLIESEGRQSLRVRRYRPAPSADRPAGAGAGAAPLGGRWSLADVKDAAGRVAPEVLQAALFDLGAGGYDLTARQLRELERARVPSGVIDQLVAMSFPKRFAVERAATGGMATWDPSGWDTGWPFGMGGLWPFDAMWPAFGSSWWMRGDPYYSTYYSPFGYRTWGYYDPYYFPDLGIVVVPPSHGSPAVDAPGDGRVVAGQGYTRIRRVDPEPAVRTSNGGLGGGATTSSTAGASGGSSGVSSSGYSGGGGSSSSGDRTAVPRPPGD